ncbi:MAG: hypothetical protein ABI460_07870 [Caldimonas sp.]
MKTETPHGNLHDFDFLAGRWNVRNRRLTTRLRHADDWTEFPATSLCEPRLGGGANIEQLDFPTLGFSGLTVRLFDTAERRWSIYWVNSRDGRMTPPVVGGFDGNHGEFRGRDSDDGREVAVRFVWTHLGADSARWEQAFSLDGQAWETNWIMEFSRA